MFLNSSTPCVHTPSLAPTPQPPPQAVCPPRNSAPICHPKRHQRTPAGLFPPTNSLLPGGYDINTPCVSIYRIHLLPGLLPPPPHEHLTLDAKTQTSAHFLLEFGNRPGRGQGWERTGEGGASQRVRHRGHHEGKPTGGGGEGGAPTSAPYEGTVYNVNISLHGSVCRAPAQGAHGSRTFQVAFAQRQTELKGAMLRETGQMQTGHLHSLVRARSIQQTHKQSRRWWPRAGGMEETGRCRPEGTGF